MQRILLFSGFLIVGVLGYAQTTPSPAPQQQAKREVRDAVQGGWSIESLDAPASTDMQLFYGMPTPQSQLDLVRNTRNEALIRNEGRVSAADQSRLDGLSRQVSSSFPNSFEANMAAFYAEFPSSAAFDHLEQAMVLDVGRPELIGPRLVRAARMDQEEELVRAARLMKDRGQVAPGLLRMAEDLLLSVDKKGILITAGEMDAYPAWVEQHADGKRNDVTVIDHRLLDDASYRIRMWSRVGAKGSAPVGRDPFIEGLLRATERPVFLSLALGPVILGKYQDRSYVSGLAVRLSTSPAGDPVTLASRWRSMRKALDAGPLSSNYLVPGSALLKYYRSMGDERNASLLEAELRAIGERTGDLKRLYSTGVLQH